MNFVLLSPNFPPGYYRFGEALKNMGAHVFGVGEMNYDSLSYPQKKALTEYYRVDSLHDYDQVLRALGYFTYRYGKLDQIDSFNEYWLGLEARLRRDFNIEGLMPTDLNCLQKKSCMKKIFARAGVPSASGGVFDRYEDAKVFALENGFPLIAKPDSGVGASDTFRIEDMQALEQFFCSAQRQHTGYFLETFINGSLESFDGLTNQNGQIVFYTSHVFCRGIMDIVNQDLDMFYYSRRDVPEALRLAGEKIVAELNLRGRFFHIEFFRTTQDNFVALEINLRPPGGLTVDMFDYAFDFDVFFQWAEISMYNRFKANTAPLYHVCYVGRKNRYHYSISHDEVLKLAGASLVQHEAISPVLSTAIGDYGYIVRGRNLDDVTRLAELILQKEDR